MKKTFALILSMVLLCGMFTACSDTQTNSSSKTSESTDAVSTGSEENKSAEDGSESKNNGETDSGGETTEISWFLGVGDAPSKWDESQYVMKTITESTGVTVSANTPADDAATVLNLMIINGDLPDLITVTPETDALIRDMVEADLVWPLQEFFETYLPDSHIINGGFPEDIKGTLIARDGDWYSYPSHMLSPENREIWGLNPATEELWLNTDVRDNRMVVVNARLMEEIGITEEELQTESSFLDALEKVKNANVTVDGASVIPLLADGGNFNGHNWQSDHGATDTLAWMFGAVPVDNEGNFQTLYRTDGFRHAMKFFNTAAQRGYIDANQFTFDNAAIEAAYRSGRVFAFIGHSSNTGFDDIVNNGFGWYTPGLLLSDGGESPVFLKNGTVGRGWLQTFVTKDAKNPEAVAKFIDYMSSEEGYKIWKYGEPEVDFELTEDGLYRLTEEGSAKANNAAVTGLGAFWAFVNQNCDQKLMDPSNDLGILPQCEFGTNENTVVVEAAALYDLPGSYLTGNPEMLAISNEVYTSANTGLANIVLQATDDDFDAQMDSFISSLDTLGLTELEAYINEAVQSNYETMGIDPIKPVN